MDMHPRTELCRKYYHGIPLQGAKDKNYNGLIRMLDLLLNMYSETGKARSALDILESDYNIPLRSFNKEVDSMCNLSQGIYDDGIAAGIAKGKADGAVNKAVTVVKNLLSKGFSLDEALAVADIDKATYEKHCSDPKDK